MKTDNHIKTISTKRKILFSVIMFCLFLILIAITETAVRFTTPYIPSINFYISGQTHADSKNGENVFEGDPLLGWRLKANLDNVWWDYTTFNTNNRHIRYENKIGKKSPGTFRIVCLGDSVTFGFRIPTSWQKNPNEYDHASIPFTKIMEKSLRSTYKNDDIQVIPFAVPGYTSYQGLAWMKDSIKWLNPDVVIVNFGYNDTNHFRQEYKTSFPVNWYSVYTRWLASKSQTVIHLSRWYASHFNKIEPVEGETLTPAVSSEDYINNILSITKLAIINNASVVVIGQVYKKPIEGSIRVYLMGENRTLLANTCQENNIPYLEIEELTENYYPRNEHLFDENVHPNKAGHILMAKRLLDFLGEKGILAELNKDILK